MYFPPFFSIPLCCPQNPKSYSRPISNSPPAKKPGFAFCFKIISHDLFSPHALSMLNSHCFVLCGTWLQLGPLGWGLCRRSFCVTCGTKQRTTNKHLLNEKRLVFLVFPVLYNNLCVPLIQTSLLTFEGLQNPFRTELSLRHESAIPDPCAFPGLVASTEWKAVCFSHTRGQCDICLLGHQCR